MSMLAGLECASELFTHVINDWVMRGAAGKNHIKRGVSSWPGGLVGAFLGADCGARSPPPHLSWFAGPFRRKTLGWSRRMVPGQGAAWHRSLLPDC